MEQTPKNASAKILRKTLKEKVEAEFETEVRMAKRARL
jgi:hypothetical protein